MSVGAAPCELRSAWKPAGGSPLAAALRVVREDEEGEEDAGGKAEDPGPGDGSSSMPELLRLCRPRIQVEEQPGSSCCLLEVSCPGSRLWVSAVSVESEARTVELYADGEYVGSARGRPLLGGRCRDTGDEVTLYAAWISREFPSPSCEIKLLSLGDKECVRIGAVTVWLRAPRAGAPTVPGVTVGMARVRAMVEATGTALSPGAHSLMGLVQQHQQNQRQATTGHGLQAMLMAGLGGAPGGAPGGVDLPSLLRLGAALARRPVGDGALPPPASPAPALLQSPLVSSAGAERRAAGSQPVGAASCSGGQLHADGEDGRPGDASDGVAGAQPAPPPGDDLRARGSASGGRGGRSEDARALEELLLARVEEAERRLMAFVDLRLQTLQAHFDAQFVAVRRLLVESDTTAAAAGGTRGSRSDCVTPNETALEDGGAESPQS